MDKFLARDKIHTVYPIDEKNFRIEEMGVCNAYLLLGSKEALLIDSGVGLGDIFETVRQITALSITLALTHGHVDHGRGRDF